MSLRPDQIEELIAARVATTDATPYDQSVGSSQARDLAFRESENPLVINDETRVLSHLRYWVLIHDAPVVGDRQAPGTDAKVISSCTVSFLYRIRPGKQKTDQRLASRAAIAIIREVKALPQSEWVAQLVNGWLPQVDEDAAWLLVDMTFLIHYDMPV